MKKKSFSLGLLIFSAAVFMPIVFLAFASPGLAQDFPDVCQEAENILPNCTFDAGLNGWQTFTEAGSAQFSVLQGGGECHAPLCPAAYIVVEDHFVGGIYQQVSVTPGTNYYANIVWLVFDSLANDAGINSLVGGIGRRIGVDPTGGTDSTSSNVVWSTDNWRNDCKICNIEHVTVTAQADTITIFLRLDDTWKLKAAEKGYPIPPSKDQFWIDDMGLKPVGGEPVPVEVLPTDTPVPPPPTDTPVPQLPTNTPPPDTPAPETEITSDEVDSAETSESTEMAQAQTPASEPVSPVATPTAAPTNTPPAAPPTLTPTHTPPPTSTPLPKPSPTPVRINENTPEPENSSTDTALMLSAIGSAVCIGGLVLLIVAAILGGLVWLYRLGWGSNEEDDDDNFDDELPSGPPPTLPEQDTPGELSVGDNNENENE